MNKSYYPINLDVEDKKCLVVGGGKVAERKVKTLLKFGAKVTVVSPSFSSGLSHLANELTLIKRAYRASDLNGSVLVIAATDQPATNRRIAADARKNRVLVNVIDKPELCSFIAPSVIKRGPLVVSISTSGQAPAFSKTLRLKLEKIVTPAMGRLAGELGRIRRQRRGTASDRA